MGVNFAMKMYDRFGFDKDGYNKDGFDRMGYNRQGYDRDGYDKNGMNQQGFNKLTGYDEDGYDEEGYDKDGFDRSGYNRSGYDKDGFDIKGYNLAGYNRDGYDKQGFDIMGYNHDGYDRQGYDTDGYDKEGYDKDGFNKDGFDAEGYDVEGYDIYGFDREGINKNGYDINGKSEEGKNVLGYFEDGFDEEGKTIDGFPKEVFDEDGYHIYTGFNQKGYDRNGYNINGIDEDGYDREGFHYQTGFNREGYDREGYGIYGYNIQGYDRRGYNREGYDVEGYNVEGYDDKGFDKDGYDKDGYDKKGYDINGYDKNGFLDENRRALDINTSVDLKEDLREASFFKKCEKQIKGYYKKLVEKEVMMQYAPTKREYIDRWGYVHSDVVEPDKKQAKREIDHQVNRVLKNPYFCHVDYSGNPELYIGKQAVHGWITDWADEQAKLYYDYKMYIGNKDFGLNLVRDIHFLNGKYCGYKDKYYKNSNAEETVIADEHLQQIIKANQDNKTVHDIVESIQQNQYDIISDDKEKSTLVLGCAGSGKTMILMHKVRYMKYNDKDLDMNDIIIISPTDILQKESRQLSRLLQVDRVLQFTCAGFYLKLCMDMMKKASVPYEAFTVIDNNSLNIEYYQHNNLERLKHNVELKLNSGNEGKDFLAQEADLNKKMFSKHVALTGQNINYVTKMHNLYADSVKEIEKAGKQDIERIIKEINSVIKEQTFLIDLKEFIEVLLKANVFENNSNKIICDEETLSKLFYETKKVIKNLDDLEFYRAINLKKNAVSDSVKMIQVVQLYLGEKLKLEEIHKILKEWSEITAETASAYIAYVSKQIDRIDALQKKADIMKYLLVNGMVSDRYMDNKQIKFDTSFEKLLKLYEEMEIPLEQIGMTPFEYFTTYEKISRRRRRLSDQKKHPLKMSYLFDAILEELNIEYSLDEEIQVPLSKIFAMAYILYTFCGSINAGKKYIFIDEFQDFSSNELLLMKNAFPNAVFNLYGDVNQCVNSKGIHKVEDIPKFMYEGEPKSINENYRNARQITEYVNNVMDMEMLPVGLDGIYRELPEIPDITIEMDDRVAIIVPEVSGEIKEILCEYDVNYYEETREIIRGIWNVLPIALAKGLEFEKVVVLRYGMTKNEYYVACTRAIKELYVLSELKEDIDTKILHDTKVVTKNKK